MRVIVAVVIAGAVFAGVLALGRSCGRTSEQPMTATRDGLRAPGGAALEELRREIDLAEQPRRRTDSDRLIDARAWVAEHRPDGWPYAELEARMLAHWESTGQAEARSAAWAMQNARLEIEMIRALDADGDGVVSDDEVERFAAFSAETQDPGAHPYMIEMFDTDGDGVLSFDENPWQRTEAMLAQSQGLAERVRADLWDTDGDGQLSEAERTAGASRALLSAKLFADGHIEYVADPGEGAADEQALIREKLLEEFGQETLELTLDRQESAAQMFLTIEMGEAMRLVEGRPDYAAGGPGPAMPEVADYDPDGDGRFEDDAQLARYMEAMEAWEAEQRLHSARQMAGFYQDQFEAALLDADFNHDTRLTPDEWDAHLDNLLHERDRELFLRHYDLDRSGRVTDGELETFLGWFRAGSLRADANYDGSIDLRDLERVAEAYQAQ